MAVRRLLRSRANWLCSVLVLCSPVVACGSGGGDSAAAPPGSEYDGSAGGVPGTDAGSDSLIPVGDGASSDGDNSCQGGCPENMICSHGECVPKEALCNSDNDCSNDSYCDPDQGCVPWGTPSDKTHDPGCLYVTPPGIFAPKTRCEFSTPPSGDPFPNHRDVQATPTVVNFHRPTSSGSPSIVVPFTDATVQPYTETQGIVRIIRGSDCQSEAVLGGSDVDGDGAVDWIRSPSTPAIGDLDGDGVPEVIVYGADDSTLAFTLKSGAWSLLWKARSAVGGPVFISGLSGAWAGPSIHDLDDDGAPEIIREGYVISSQGILLGGLPSGYSTYSSGLNATLADVDGDGKVELLNGQYIWQWNAGAWETEPYYAGPGPGHVAVADFGPYGAVDADAGADAGPHSTGPEIALVRLNTLSILALDGSVVFGPIALPPGGSSGAGGPPTIADYDGDGYVEVGVAGSDFYSVFDIDCTSAPRAGGKCEAQDRCDNASGVPGPCPSGILWSRKTQDHSSNITGSSVFDFEADGPAEVVYADECFARVYNGKTGEVLFSQYHSSCTWYENPIVADVDGNFRADLVVPSNVACDGNVNPSWVHCRYNAADPNNSSLDENNVDKEFAGLRCKTNSDCVSQNCSEGFCRCTESSQCCALGDSAQCEEFGYKCAPPLAGTPGTGNTCRASHPHKYSGVRVYSDATDKWVRSRTIWNQHAYAVTHVDENGVVPRTSQWLANWEQPTLNNFRQNVPGTPNGQLTADPTAGASSVRDCSGSSAVLHVPICNRGADAVGTGLSVSFYDGTTLVCQTRTTEPLQPGQCQNIECTWSNPPTSSEQAKDIVVIVNEDGDITECKDGNNRGLVKAVWCSPITK